jgi:hypothetical protein
MLRLLCLCVPSHNAKGDCSITGLRLQ